MEEKRENIIFWRDFNVKFITEKIKKIEDLNYSNVSFRSSLQYQLLSRLVSGGDKLGIEGDIIIILT